MLSEEGDRAYKSPPGTPLTGPCFTNLTISNNNNLIKYPGNVFMSSHDHEFIKSVSNRIIELTPSGIIDKLMDYDDYIEDEKIQALRDKMYK